MINNNKIISLCLAIACFALSYSFLTSSNIPEGMFEDPNTGKAMLLGEIAINELKQEPFKSWYFEEFNRYKVDQELIAAISNPSQYSYELFLGTWCADSRREVPRIEKIFTELDINLDKVKIITVDRNKVSPENEQEGKDIRYVPTLIVRKEGIEVGRIVESPSSESASLESDLFEISLGIPPAPNYSEN